MSKLIKEMLDALNAVNQNKTQPFDRQGEVKRIEGKIAWVKLEGSDRETPIQMTIACDVGDTVQARIGGGSAWLTGNLTAPPTDDKKANEAITMVTNIAETVQETVDEALEDIASVEDVRVQYCLSTSSSTFIQDGDWSNTPPAYQANRYYWTRTVIEDEDGNEVYGTPQYSQDTQLSVETSRAYATTDAHFWYDSTGAYVTNATKTDYKSSASNKYATRVTPTGILQSYSGNLLSAWTSSGIGFYAGDGTTADNSTKLAQFGSGGVNLYGGGYLGASVTSSGMSVYSSGSKTAEFSNSGATFYTSSNNPMAKIYADELDGYTRATITNDTYTKKAGVRLYSHPTTGQADFFAGDSHVFIYNGTSTKYVQITSTMFHVKSDETTFTGIIRPAVDTNPNCGTGDHPWHNVYVNTFFASTVEPSQLSQDYPVAWHKTDSNNYVLCRPSSSRKWKKDIEPISDAIADPKKLYDVRVVQFRYKDKNADDPNNTKYNPTALDVGFIAEEVAEAYPLGAVINEDGEPDDWFPRRIIPPMLALIQEQNKRITALEERLS